MAQPSNHYLAAFLNRHGISQAEFARALGMKNRATAHRKLRGTRPWTVEEANAAVAFLRERLKKPRLTLDDLFGREAA